MRYFNETENRLTATFKFSDFQDAINFVNTLAQEFESKNHHPDISLHDYKFITISTTTHDAGNMLTQKDYDIARIIEDQYDNNETV